MTNDELKNLIQQLKSVFDIVRLVDVSLMMQFTLDENGEFHSEPYRCYAVWNKKRRCENCISAKALTTRGKATKFEFVGNDVYHVTAKYIKWNETPYVLEMVSRVSDETLFGAYGKGEFIKTITNYNERLYIDTVTGAYNRRYYEEQLSGLSNLCGVAMMDVDNFKRINDSYGHAVGDQALALIAKTTQACAGDKGTVVRYGGDEFLILFQDISKENLHGMLEQMKECVWDSTIEDVPELRLSVSIGGVFCPGGALGALKEADQLLYEAKTTKNKMLMK